MSNQHAKGCMADHGLPCTCDFWNQKQHTPNYDARDETIREQLKTISELNQKILGLKVSRKAALSREQEANRNWSTDAKQWHKERAKHNSEIIKVLERVQNEINIIEEVDEWQNIEQIFLHLRVEVINKLKAEYGG